MGGRSAAIVGGGIGGLAAAIALLRTGWDVRVYERASGFTEVGAGISLWPNALRALERLGLLPEVLDLGKVEVAGGAKDRQGRWLTRVTSAELERRFGYPLVVVHRLDLLAALLGALPGEVLRPGVLVTEPPEADLVVAADGLRSTVRARLWPDVRLRYAGHTAWRMVTRRMPSLSQGAVVWGRGERFGFASLPGGRVYCFGTATVFEGGASPDGEHPEVLRRFSSWPEPIPTLLKGVPPESVLRHDVYDLPPLRSFVQGATALLGDAAHAMTPSLGQGACQALEDAVVLADCLAGVADVPAGLTRYDRLRRPRAQAVVRRSARLNAIGQLAWPPAVVARDLLVRLIPAELALRSMTPVIGFRV